MELVSYGGWERCARLALGDQELIITLDVGPRIIRLGFVGGLNELHENSAQMGLTGGDQYRSYGGHRLWIAPEDPVRTMQPDNDPVEWFHGQDGYEVFRSKADRFHIQKELAIRVNTDPQGFVLRHRLINRGAHETSLIAPWALTVMAPGGECLFPHAPFQPHPERLLPVSPLVLWSYTRMNDHRCTWGPDLVRLRHDPDAGPQKVGSFVHQGYAAYANHGNLFLKRFGADQGAAYPDMGCNFETFTRSDMLEVESLGPLQRLQPGEEHAAEHYETWYLVPAARPPSGNTEAAKWLAELASSRPYLS